MELTLWSVFWRTFAQLFAPYVAAAMVVDWLSDYRIGAVQLAIGFFMAAVGGVIAVLIAMKSGLAQTAIAKAFRSGLEALVTVLGGVVVNELADFVTLPRVLIPGLIGVVLAFGLTYFQNQGALPTPPVPSSNP